MELKGLRIKETTEKDLENVALLWNAGEVMKFVGFPDGLGVTVEQLKKKWLPFVNQNDKRRHYSIYHDELGFCGESYYSVEENGRTPLDIKLFSKARGKGIAYNSLKYAIDKAFSCGNAKVVYVDPDKRNEKALALYKKLGFKEFPHPDKNERQKHYYFEISKNDWSHME